jgi:hypothetical protein
MLDGFYLMQVEAVQGGGGGVAVLSKGHIFGGDTGFYYVGRYEPHGESLTARVTDRRFLAGESSVFGIDGDYDVVLAAALDGDIISGRATVPSHPEFGMVIRLTKRGILP